MRQLELPTVQLVKEYANRFTTEPNTGQFDLALRKLFTAFPRNAELSDVCLKGAALNFLYATNIYAIFDVAQHIHRLQVDAKLAAQDLELVHDIAYVKIGEKIRRNYSFASKYCAWHAPAAYAM